MGKGSGWLSNLLLTSQPASCGPVGLAASRNPASTGHVSFLGASAVCCQMAVRGSGDLTRINCGGLVPSGCRGQLGLRPVPPIRPAPHCPLHADDSYIASLLVLRALGVKRLLAPKDKSLVGANRCTQSACLAACVVRPTLESEHPALAL